MAAVTTVSTESSRVALIIPTLDEEEAIGRTLAEVPRHELDRVIITDSGSTDRTTEIASNAGAEVLMAGRGFGRACLEAARFASDADILVFMDGDGADDPAQIPMLVAPIALGDADFVLASRVLGKREPGSMSWHQIAAGRAAGFGMRLLYGTRYSDMCTFRAIRREILLGLGMRELTYGWNIEMQMRAARAGLRILEIPVPYRVRNGGVSKVAGNLRGTLRAGTRIVSTFFRVAAQPAPDLSGTSPDANI
jgi:glycosyltransferase involved in cell wall biosynthesis